MADGKDPEGNLVWPSAIRHERSAGGRAPSAYATSDLPSARLSAGYDVVFVAPALQRVKRPGARPRLVVGSGFECSPELARVPGVDSQVGKSVRIRKDFFQFRCEGGCHPPRKRQRETHFGPAPYFVRKQIT